MSTNPDDQNDQLVEIAKAIGAILGVPVTLFAVISSSISQPNVALIVALITAILASVWAVRSHWINITGVVIGWLSLILVGLAIFVIWPRTIQVEGTIRNTTRDPIVNQTVVLIDANGVTRQANTDTNGHYQFINVPTGPYTVRVGDIEGGGGAGGFFVRRVETNLTIRQAATEATQTPIAIAELTSTPTSTNTTPPTSLSEIPTVTPQPTNTFTPSPSPTFTTVATDTPTATATITPTEAPEFIEQAPYAGDCANRPANSVCIGFSDGYTWLVTDAIQGWEEGGFWLGQEIQVAQGFQADYYHVLGTSLIKKITK